MWLTILGAPYLNPIRHGAYRVPAAYPAGMSTGPPGYAWDWVSRQRLVWREARSRLARHTDPVGARYRVVSAKPDVVPLLRRDYPDDHVVREVLQSVVRDLVFLGRTDRTFTKLGLHNAPRGLRWWWRELTGEDVTVTPPPQVGAPADRIPEQLDLEDVLGGYGD